MGEGDSGSQLRLIETLVDPAESPFDNVVHGENRARVEAALNQVPEPYRSTLILRDIEGICLRRSGRNAGRESGNGQVAAGAWARLFEGVADGSGVWRTPGGKHGIRSTSGRGGTMNGCSSMQTRFTEYLDGRLTGREMQRVAAHMERCPECADEWKLLRQTQSALATLGAGAGA